MTDAELVELTRGGESKAYAGLVERHRAALQRLCLRVTGNRPDAEELAHDAFVEGYLKLAQLRDPEKFLPWLRALALNLCRAWYRRRQREAPEPREEELAAAPETPEDRSRAVRRGIGRLSRGHRLALLLHYWEGLSYAEVAQFLDVPVGTVMSRLHRARRELQDRMLEPEEEDGMEEVDDEQFTREVQAEIAVLLRLFREQPEARERLQVILQRSPERLPALVREADGPTRANLALLLRRLGRGAREALLGAALSRDRALREPARDVLKQYVALPRSGDGPAVRMAAGQVYLLLEALPAEPGTEEEVVDLLLEWLDSAPQEETRLLLVNLLLCYPEQAWPRLRERFWSALPAELSRGETLFALCRYGVRFGAELVAPLRDGNAARKTRALAGAEALARSLAESAALPPEHSESQWRQEARFRRKWPAVLPTQRDTNTAAALADACAELARNPDPALRESAVRTLGVLGAAAHVSTLLEAGRDPVVGVRTAALRALGETGSPGAVALLRETAWDTTNPAAPTAVEMLGRLRVMEAEPWLCALLDPQTPAPAETGTPFRRAAVFALAELGTENARDRLVTVGRFGDPELREAVGRALHRLRPRRAASGPGVVTARLREGAPPPAFSIAPDAAIRALPELRPYKEGELTRLLARTCSDYSSTRRYLVDLGLMTREAGQYTLTPTGEAIWRVEQFVEARYMGC